jgi:hypothetical protein
MIKHNLITVEYRPHARRKHRFRFNVWRNGRIVKSRCARDLECYPEVHMWMNLNDDKYPVHIPFSACIAELIRKKNHYRGWIKSEVKRKWLKNDFYSYNMYEITLRHIFNTLRRKKQMYQVSDELIQKAMEHDPNANPVYPFHDRMELYEFYHEFRKWQDDLYPKNMKDLTNELRYQIDDLWNVIRMPHIANEFDCYKCMGMCISEEEMDKELAEVTAMVKKKMKEMKNG